MKRIGVALVFWSTIVSQAVFAQFSSNLSASALQAAVKTQADQGKSAVDIARAALASGVDAGSLTTAMLLAGIPQGTAIEAVLRAGGDPALVQSAALANQVSQSVITAAGARAGITLPPAGPFAGGAGSPGFGPTGSGYGSPGAGGGGAGSRR